MAVKLKDIASETGFSISTVSRILNKDATRKAGDKTAAKVIDAAQRMGFFSEGKNVRLSSSGISISKTYSIGCILTSAHETFVSPFFSAINLPRLLRPILLLRQYALSLLLLP